MKYIKIILYVLIILMVIIIGRGLMTPNIEYSSEIKVDKPIKEAWSVMQDESKITEWLQDITEVKHVSGNKGNVGAVTQYTFEQNGQESTILETIRSITPDEQIKMDFDAPGAMHMAYTVDMSEENGKTNIRSSTVVEGDGFMMKCLIPWIKGSMISQEDINMGNLQKLINENTTNYFPEPVLEMATEVENN